MSLHHHARGAAPVGHVGHLQPAEQLAVGLLRARTDGPEALAEIEAVIRPVLGPERTEHLFDALAQLCQLCEQHGRRPLLCHGCACSCLGADESCFANFIACASDGQREDAMLMATLLVRPDYAPYLVGHAETLGRCLALFVQRTYRAHITGRGWPEAVAVRGGHLVH